MGTTLPPILLRNTYPPGQPEIGWAPRPLRRTPQGIAEIMSPGSIIGTHFQGPVVSGPAPGINGAAGAAQLSVSLQVDWSMGNFQLPITFPGGSFLQSVDAVTYEDGINAAITLGTESGQSDIAEIALPAKGAVAPPVQPEAQLPLWDAVQPQEPFTCWLNVSANTGSTTGGAIILLNYVRIAAPWSEPATNYNRP